MLTKLEVTSYFFQCVSALEGIFLLYKAWQEFNSRYVVGLVCPDKNECCTNNLPELLCCPAILNEIFQKSLRKENTDRKKLPKSYLFCDELKMTERDVNNFMHKTIHVLHIFHMHQFLSIIFKKYWVNANSTSVKYIE